MEETSFFQLHPYMTCKLGSVKANDIGFQPLASEDDIVGFDMQRKPVRSVERSLNAEMTKARGLVRSIKNADLTNTELVLQIHLPPRPIFQSGVEAVFTGQQSIVAASCIGVRRFSTRPA